MPAIDGLGSGLDTTTIIQQLMQLERLPQQRASTMKTAAVTRSTTWTQLGLAVGAVATAAAKLTTPDQVWGPATGTSSDTKVVGVRAGTGALPGEYEVTVQQLATAQRTAYTFASPPTVGVGSLVLHDGLGSISSTPGSLSVDDALAPATTPSGKYTVTVEAIANTSNYTVTVASSSGVVGTATTTGADASGLTVNGIAFTGDVKPGKAEIAIARTKDATAGLTDLAREIAAAGGVATATVVTGGDGRSSLTLTARETGASFGLTVDTTQTVSLGSASLTAGKDAKLAVAGYDVDGLPGDDVVTRPSNTIADLLPGVTLTLAKEDPAAVTVTVAQDIATPTASLKGLVDAVNALFTQVTGATKYDAVNKKSATLGGNAAARGLATGVYTTLERQVLSDAQGDPNGKTLSTLGLKVNSDGTYAFDTAKFQASLKADPAATAALAAEVGKALHDYAKRLNEPTVTSLDGTRTVPGVIASARETAQADADRLQKQVDRWETRLAITQARLTKQYTMLDTALSSLKSQGTWLGGAIGTLGSWNPNL